MIQEHKVDEKIIEQKIASFKQSRRSTIKTRGIDPELQKIEEELHKVVNEEEAKKDESEKIKPLTKGDKFKRIMSLTTPKANVVIGIIASFIQGGIMPVFGILLGYILFQLSAYSVAFPIEGNTVYSC